MEGSIRSARQASLDCVPAGPPGGAKGSDQPEVKRKAEGRESNANRRAKDKGCGKRRNLELRADIPVGQPAAIENLMDPSLTLPGTP